VTVGDVDNDPAGLTVTASSSNAALLPNSGIQVLPGSAPNRRWLRLTPNNGIGAQTNVTVTVNDGSGRSCVATLSAGSGSCSLTLSLLGTWTLTATYSGDANFNSGFGNAPHTVAVLPFTFVGFQTPLVTAGTLSNPSTSPPANLGSAVPIKWMLSNFAGNVTDLSTTLSLKAIVNQNCSGVPTGTEILLYSPTTGAKGGSTFRSSSSGFIFNWDTSTGVSTGKGCYTIVLQLSDGSSPKATTLRLK